MSAKRKKRAPKSGAVWRMSAKEATLAKKPRYNGYVCGHGAHGDAKYSRMKSKRAWQKQLKQEGAPRGSFLFTFCLHSGRRKQRAHEPERGHTASETAAVAKDGTRFAQNMKKAYRTRHAHAAESAPLDAQTRISV